MIWVPNWLHILNRPPPIHLAEYSFCRLWGPVPDLKETLEYIIHFISMFAGKRCHSFGGGWWPKNEPLIGWFGLSGISSTPVPCTGVFLVLSSFLNYAEEVFQKASGLSSSKFILSTILHCFPFQPSVVVVFWSGRIIPDTIHSSAKSPIPARRICLSLKELFSSI